MIILLLRGRPAILVDHEAITVLLNNFNSLLILNKSKKEALQQTKIT